MVEHLEPAYLIRFIEAAHRAMKADAPLVLETINAACWSAFFDSYIRDFTHVRPLHPDTMRYLVQASGFRSVEIQFRSPFAERRAAAHSAASIGGVVPGHDGLRSHDGRSHRSA